MSGSATASAVRGEAAEAGSVLRRGVPSNPLLWLMSCAATLVRGILSAGVLAGRVRPAAGGQGRRREAEPGPRGS